MFKIHTSVRRFVSTTSAMVCAAFMVNASATISPYSQDFEGLVDTDTGALAAEGWIVFGNVFDGEFGTGDYLYGYGPFPAPNDGSGFSGIVVGEGGTAQGAQQMVVYNDYSAEHMVGNLVEASVFLEFTITADDVGKTFTFQYDAKKGDIGGATTANAFMKTIDPMAGFFVSNLETNDTTSLPVTWGTYSLSLTIDAGLVGQLFQIGFSSTATFFEASGNLYDNISLAAPVDTDGDGVSDATDNCTNEANPGQEDTDGDLIGNRCDGDFNNDCIVNFPDIGTFGPQFLGTNPLYDHDGSGAVNFADYAILTSYFLQPPGPSAAGCN